MSLGSYEGAVGHRFWTFGFPLLKNIEGLPETGIIAGETRKTGTGISLLRLKSDTVTGGFSGGPVYDLELRRVVAITSDTIDRDERGQIGGALAVAAEVLRPLSSALRWSEVRPYRGLESFGEAQADIYCGRQKEVDRLVARMREAPRFLAVLGPSGSGKSSLVHAGLVPRVRSDPTTRRWTIELARGDTADLAFKITTAAEYSGAERLLLIVDQFEEIFTTEDPASLSETLLRMQQLLTSGAKATVLIVMRDDFYNRLPQEAPGMAKWLENGTVNVAPILTREDILAMIAEPAKRVGLVIESGLAERIADDAVRLDPPPWPEQDSARTTILPLLEFTLDRLFDNREDGMLVNDAYPSSGVTSMLAEWAGDTYRKISADLQPFARRFFTELVHAADENEAMPLTRRRRRIRELWSNETEREIVEELISAFTAARLLVTAGGRGSDETVEIIHESLIRTWGDLRSWVRERREFLVWRTKVVPRVEHWNRTHADDSLLRGLELSGLNPEFEAEMNAIESAFLEESRKAERSREEVERERRIESESRELAAAAFTQLQMDPELSVILSFEAVCRRPTPEAYDALQEAVGASRVRKTITGYGKVSSVVFNGEGDLLLLGCDDGTARIVRTTGEPVFSLPPSGREIAWASFNSSRETMIATASLDGVVRIWKWDGEQETAVFECALGAHPGGAYCAAFHPTLNVIATAGADQEILIWDINSREAISRWNASRKVVHGIAFHPEGYKLAAACGDNALRIWDWRGSHELLYESESFDDHVSAVCWSGDGRRLAASSYDGTARVYRFEQSGAPRPAGSPVVLQASNNWLLSIALDRRGERVATGGFDQSASVWDVASGKLIARLRGHKERVTGVAFHSDQLATSGADESVRLWDVSEIPDQLTVTSQDERLFTAGFDAARKYFFTASDTKVRLWEVEGRHQRGTFEGINAALSPDGERLAIVRLDRIIHIMSVRGRKTQSMFPGQDGWTIDMAWRSDGLQIATCGSDEKAALWNLNDPKHPILLTLHSDWVNGLAYSPDGAVLATTSNDRTIRLWSTATGEAIDKLGDRSDGHRHWIHGVCFDSTGTALATASHDKTVKVWNLRTGEATTYEGHTDWVRDVDFSPDGDLLASCGKDKTICIWAREVPWHPIRVIRGHADEVWKVEFLNRQTLASVSWDQTARLWDIESGQEIGIFRGYRSPVRFTPYSPDGSSRLYRIHLEALMALAETRRTRSLTPWERQRFLHESNEERM